MLELIFLIQNVNSSNNDQKRLKKAKTYAMVQQFSLLKIDISLVAQRNFHAFLSIDLLIAIVDKIRKKVKRHFEALL